MIKILIITVIFASFLLTYPFQIMYIVFAYKHIEHYRFRWTHLIPFIGVGFINKEIYKK